MTDADWLGSVLSAARPQVIAALLRRIAGTTKPTEPSRELVSAPVVWRESVQTRDVNVTQLKSRRRDT